MIYLPCLKGGHFSVQFGCGFRNIFDGFIFSGSGPPPPYGSNWGHEIANFVFLPYIYFILAFGDLQ